MLTYKKNKLLSSRIKENKALVGETIEDRVTRMLYQKDSIEDGAPLIYTDRRKGVMPEHDIRTDRFDFAVMQMDDVTKKGLEKRMEFYKPDVEKTVIGEDGKVNATE